MESYGKHRDAAGRDPDFGAIFMSSSATLQECFRRRLVGLPSSCMPFVKQIKAGMLLFLFEYDKRELYGVFESCCDGAMNIVPSAFSSSGRQFPAQVEFSPIWDCKPLKESEFRDAIRENYISTNKFNFGLSEEQVHRLLKLFSKRKLPGRQVKHEHYPVGKVGRSVGGRMHAEILKNEQDTVASTLPLTMHNYQRDSFHSSVEVDDEEHSIGMQRRPAISSGLSGNFPGAITVHDDRLHVSERLLSKHKIKPGQRFLDDRPSLHNSNVGSYFFSSEPMSDPDYLGEDQLVATSAMPHLTQDQISVDFCEAQRNLCSQSTLLYGPDTPGCNIRQTSSVRIGVDDSSKSMGGSASPSNNFRRNIMHSLDDPPSYVHAELKDTSRSQGFGYGLNNSAPFGSNVTSMTLCADQNSERLSTKPVEYEGLDSSPFRSSSDLLPHLCIRNNGWGSEPYSPLCDKYNTHLSDDYCSIPLLENLGHDEMTLQNNETCAAMLWENEDHSQTQDGDSLFHEHDLDLGSYGNSGYKKKNSVFSRLSFVHPSNNKKHGSNHNPGGYDICSLNSVDEIMNMVRQSCKPRGMKRKINPWVKLSKAESLRDRKIRNLNDSSMDSMDTMSTKIRSLRSKKASSEKSLDDTSMDIMIAADGSETNQIDEGTRFVDFKRRSQVQRNNETRIRGSDESERSGDLQTMKQKKRKLIRPNFTKSTTPNGKNINLDSSQNSQVPSSLGNLEPKDDSKSCESVTRAEENCKIDGTVLTLDCQKHFKNKSDHVRGVNSEGGGNPREGRSLPKIGLNDGSKCLKHVHNQNASSSAFCEARSFHGKEGLRVKDDIKSFSDTGIRHSICQAHSEEKVIGGNGYINTGEGTLQDGKRLLPTEVQDVPESEMNSGKEDASNHINIGEGTLKDGKQPLPTECQDVPESEMNSGNEDASNHINIGEETSQYDGKQLLPTEVQDVLESEMNSGNEDASNHINVGEGTSQDDYGKQLLPTEFQDVPGSEMNSGNEDASNHINLGEGTSQDDGKQLLPAEFQDLPESEINSGYVDASNYVNIGEGTTQDGKQLLPTEAHDVLESEKDSGNEDASNYINIGEGTSQDDKQVLPTEAHDVRESEKNSGNKDASNFVKRATLILRRTQI
ncbi:hypothetical protein QN277_010033 [Acacia crassicarpa]|uniref:DCD domain-containing protein n=1 Tax=Acacia crassicarpa TaxID=499986 RepID=A0AAE1JKA1_9FABA|nr:hypothetical protein QN277_010033 [Acacia crassicarpa]